MPPSPIREDLVVQYVHIPLEPRSNPTGTLIQSMPMAAMFMKNKLLGWSGLTFAVQNYLTFHHDLKQPEDAASPLLSLAFGFGGLIASYTDFIFPVPKSTKIIGKTAEKIAETVTSVVSSATSTATA
ncbi:uncharacterized protein ASCRUDRAFT_67907 [Ascoidea rubescens DSM 1968]|uniref:Uncharacterized protein n=1 Tax=Ascoidea rubescens DSM 1968 TaxID=1344418 RepID=A0A1D2VQK2_9ASCO|nr:hypothetical protein ASCRUDRAFT_67907 [Ascoidea rubescens DSM 1968]ODV63845.1 hypothetical protein ASCRUDRAFT_67907 [Ascoidea rubescens DSM 1968]